MNLKDSKGVAWLAVIVMVILIIFTISLRIVGEIWEYAGLFCGFMAAFCHLMALSLKKMSLDASKKLDMAALFFLGLTMVAIIVIFILFQLT